MTRGVLYKANPRVYEDYFCSQAGDGLPVFIGSRNYRGKGLGSLLGGIGRSLVPLLKKGGKTLLKESAKTGLKVAQDLLQGQSFKKSIKSRGKEVGKRLLDRAVDSVIGKPAPPGQPVIKRRRKVVSRKKKHQKKNKLSVGREPDIFG